jgi:hypothetical protein
MNQEGGNSILYHRIFQEIWRSGWTEKPVEDGGARRLVTQNLLLICRFDLPDKTIDFFRSQFAGVLGHAAFAIVDDVAQVYAGGASNFIRDEGWASEVPSFGSFAVTLDAVFLVDRVCG